MQMLMFSDRTAALLRDSGLRVAITGAGGWIGCATIEMLDSALGANFDKRVFAFGSQPKEMMTRSGRKVHITSLAELGRLPPAPTLLVHCAFLTKERVSRMSSEDYFRNSEDITRTVADAMHGIGVSHFLFPSSGAVYGLPTRSDRSLLDAPEENPYGTQKLRDEIRFRAVSKGLGIRLVVPRIFNVSGPLINKQDSYVLSSVINAVLSGAPIELHARRKVVRGYVALRDVLEVLFGWLLSSTMPEQLVLDTGGRLVEAGELAKRVLDVLHRTDLPIHRPPFGSEPDDVYFGEGAEFERLARLQGVVLSPLDDQIAETAGYLKQTQA